MLYFNVSRDISKYIFLFKLHKNKPKSKIKVTTKHNFFKKITTKHNITREWGTLICLFLLLPSNNKSVAFSCLFCFCFFFKND